MTKDEALKLALKAFEVATTPLARDRQEVLRAITAIKEALAQPAPVKIFQYNCLCGRMMKFESEHGVIAPQRTWVGLTDKELEEFSDAKLGSYDLCLEVEARLKERNT